MTRAIIAVLIALVLASPSFAAPVNEAASTTVTTNGTPGTTQNMQVPATVNANDTLVGCIGYGNVDPTTTWDNTTAGTWTAIVDASADSETRLACRWKRAAGNEDGLTLAHTSNISAGSIAIVWRISGAHTTAAIEFSSDNTQNNNLHDPPSLTPSWGSADTLWLAIAASFHGARNYDLGPTGYTDFRDDNTFDTDTGVIGSAFRTLTASSEDPPAFTFSTTARNVTVTIAFRPVAAGGGTVVNPISGRGGAAAQPIIH